MAPKSNLSLVVDNTNKRQLSVYKQFMTEDTALTIHLSMDLKKNEYETIVNLADDDELITLALDVEGIDEIIELLNAAKETIILVECGGNVVNDVEPDEDEED
jgi:hypothetical protein